MKKFFLFLFFLVALLVLVADVARLEVLHHLTKPFIMISLLGYYFSSVPSGARSFVLILALVFSWAGDVLLMFSGELFFMLGLGGFLISHVFYVLTYRQHKAEKGEGFLGVQKIRYAFPIILAGTGLLTILYPTLGGLRVPVTAYALVLVVMVLAALFRFGFTEPKSFWLVFAGAVLFMVSDSTLAINKFLQPVPNSGLLIMSTYMTAQVLIVEGLINHKESGA
jgi:uncharacterized membrane protein YhhN